METIKKLIAQEKDLTRLLVEVRGQIWQGYDRLASEKHNVKPGSIVKDWTGNLFRVVRFKHPFCMDDIAAILADEKPRLVVNAQLINGDFDMFQKYLYRWELVE